MNEELELGRRRGKKKIKVGRIIIVSILALVIVGGGGYFAITKLFPPAPEPEPITETVEPEPVRLRTSFQDAVNEEYAAAAESFVGDESELDLVARYFAINLFTMWGVENDGDYNAQDMIPEDKLGDFDKQVKANLFFRFPKIVATYGAENLPIASGLELTDVIYESVEYQGNYYDGYNATILMSYQDGTLEGTKNTDIAKANALFNQWVYSADVVFFWLPNEEGGGSWKVGIMKNVASNNAAGIIRDESATTENEA